MNDSDDMRARNAHTPGLIGQPAIFFSSPVTQLMVQIEPSFIA
jgi:hypothetical protein